VKKTLFSLAFIAASGVYVAAANHQLGLPSDEDTDLPVAKASVGEAPLQPSALPIAPVVSSEEKTIVAAAEPAQPPVPLAPRPDRLAPPPAARAKATVPTASASVPPLPRPRPTHPANVAVQAATTSTVAASSTGGYRDGTYTGTSENAYYGRVQVQVTVASQKIASIKVLDFPQDRRTSRYINSQALPLLKQEVIAANSANVDTISGATLTSEAYIRSLGRALSQAGAANA
jgi:uncharacterized protein with FMN-binding domain